MNVRRLFLLSPYRMPTNHQVYLSEDEVACWLNGFLVLWHPAMLHGSAAVPIIASAYDHESPAAGECFAVPESPPLYQPENWAERVIDAGALAFKPCSTLQETLESAQHALNSVESREIDNEARSIFQNEHSAKLWNLPEEHYLPFLGLGFGYLVIESLYEAMQHDHLLDKERFWQHLQEALTALVQPELNAESFFNALRSAAQLLQSARETLNPSTISLLDFWELNAQTVAPICKALRNQKKLTVLCTGAELKLHTSEILHALPPEQKGNLSLLTAGEKDAETGLLPLEMQLWNLRQGIQTCQKSLGIKPIGYASKVTHFTPLTPSILKDHGLQSVWLKARDAAILPSHYAAVVNWPGPDGKSIDALTKAPIPCHDVSTYFNLAYTLHQAIGAESQPTLIFLHTDATHPAYDVWQALQGLAPVLGEFITLDDYFKQAMAGEYAGSTNADDIFLDYLEQRTAQNRQDVVSGLARQAALCRKVEAAQTFDAILNVLNRTSKSPTSNAEDLTPFSDRETILKSLEANGRQLAARLQARTAGPVPGWIVLNYSSATRREALRLEKSHGPIPVEGPVKASDSKDGVSQVVVEIPPVGYAWIPNTGKGQTKAPPFKMIEDRIIRNEFLEAEFDPTTGGLRGIRDTRTRVNRLGQQLVFNPGSKMVADAIETVELGSVVSRLRSRGTLQNEQNEKLADFEQELEIWSQRPVLKLSITLKPVKLPNGAPWHAYYASRFAWRDEHAALFRGVGGQSCLTTHNRPQSADYLEIRSGRNNTCLFPGGLPFHNRPNHRMLDTLLIAPGEQDTKFTLHISLDRDLPQFTAYSLQSPAYCQLTSEGQPQSGASSWLFQIDAPNLILTSMRTLPPREDSTTAIILQLQEIGGNGGIAELRCVRNPKRAVRLDGLNEEMHELGCNGDAISVEYSAHEIVRICICFD
ncbi:hypothetical protein KIH39_11475 [Telmatocola sphagniphila]|uniref:Glycoside hydrolase family 38 N-terminal domain-containing protein n=1 Tax=Telmatocola sphagniphila TaxID=1123043 RepID=A0A8E6EWY7_9BACT|nr:hypothetical protein [Telmatocola sphagniphila]QVL34495.1 hypothetical protein KIH39_11475 [Telmatocola sphagniphila]